MATSPVYDKYTDRLRLLLSTANLSFETSEEWFGVRAVLENFRSEREHSTSPHTLLPGSVKKLLDAGLIPLLTDIVEDEEVVLTAGDPLPQRTRTAVSRLRSQRGVYDSTHTHGLLQGYSSDLCCTRLGYSN